MSYIPAEFVAELRAYIKVRKSAAEKERSTIAVDYNSPLLVSPDGSRIDRNNISKLFIRAVILAYTKLNWPTQDEHAQFTTPLDVAFLLYSGRLRGLDGAPPSDPEKIKQRRQRMSATKMVAERLQQTVLGQAEGRLMYALRKTHISWARKLVNHDSVKQQVGHAPQDVEERSYLDLVDARESAEAVWAVLNERISLDHRKLTFATPKHSLELNLAPEVDLNVDLIEPSVEKQPISLTGKITATSIIQTTKTGYALRDLNPQPRGSKPRTLSN